MTSVISRAPSPQQLISETSKRMAAGVAAVWPGKSLDFRDHERWQEEEQIRAAEALLSEQHIGNQDLHAEVLTQASADETAAGMGIVGVVDQQQRKAQTRRIVQARGKNGGKRRTIAVVVSSVIAENQDGLQAPGYSIFEQLGHHQTIDAATTDLLILIYAPSVKSYSSFLTMQAQAESENANVLQPLPFHSILVDKAASLVPHPAHILPFTTPTGYIHVLRHLAPDIVYVQENMMNGEHQSLVAQLKGWVGQTVLVVSGGSSALEAKNQPRGVVVAHIGPELREHFTRNL